MSRRRLAAIGGPPVAFVAFFFGPGVTVAEWFINTTASDPVRISAEAAHLHDTLVVADLHADSLMWDRDLDARSRVGHVDLVRLREGNVALQVFALPTRAPFGQNFDATEADAMDQIQLLGIAQLWPTETWSSLEARAHLHADELATLEDDNDSFFLVRGAEDLARLAPGGPTGGLLALEGAHCLQGDLEAVDRLFAAGFRMVGLTHFFDNRLGGSAHGIEKGGLTPFGRDVVRRMEALGIVVDLAHASPAVVDDVLDLATKPVVVSHTGVRGVCDNNRNLTDHALQRIRDNGGVVGIGFWPDAVCGDDADAIVTSIRYVTDHIGVEHVALGSDFDGAVHVPFDASGLAAITDALLAAGFDRSEIKKVMGENVVRVLRATLP